MYTALCVGKLTETLDSNIECQICVVYNEHICLAIELQSRYTETSMWDTAMLLRNRSQIEQNEKKYQLRKQIDITFYPHFILISNRSVGDFLPGDD